MSNKPRVEFFPSWGKIGEDLGAMLRCEMGWNEHTTEAFMAHSFSTLWLTMSPDPNQGMCIPALGGKASCVKELHVVGGGNIDGLEQFIGVHSITVAPFPKNGIQFSRYPNLTRVAACWDKKFSKDLFSCKNIIDVNFDGGFPDEDCGRLNTLPELLRVGFTGGSLRSLSGLEACKKLNSISLQLVRGIHDLSNISEFIDLRGLYLTNLPNLKSDFSLKKNENLRDVWFDSLPGVDGVFGFNGFPYVENIYVVKCPGVKVDLSGLKNAKNLQKLWTTEDCINMNLDDIFSCKKLKVFQCREAGDLLGRDDDLVGLAEKQGGKITKIVRNGPKKSRWIRIYFDAPDSVN